MNLSAKHVKTWAPLLFYFSNMATWITIALVARLWHLVWLVSLPLIVVLIYLVKVLKVKQ